MMTLSQRSAGTNARAKRSRRSSTPTALREANGAGLASGELAAAPACDCAGHEHAELRQVGPEAQIIGPENTSEAKPIRDALTSGDGNGSGPLDKSARPPTLTADLTG